MPDVSRPAVALLGHMTEPEALSFLQGRTITRPGDPTDFRALWLAARAAADARPTPDLKMQTREIASAHAAHLERVKSKPTFLEAVGNLEWSFQWLEVDKLLCIQQYIDENYATESTSAYEEPNEASLLEICLPVEPRARAITVNFDQVQQAYTVFSENIDLRVVGGVQSEDPITKRGLYGFAIGWGVPFVMVAHIKDRYVLKNGYHRAFGLRKREVQAIPCLVIETDRYEEAGANRPGFFGQGVLASSKPPLLSDFFDARISPNVALRVMTKILRVRAEEFALPLSVNFSVPAPPTAALQPPVQSVSIGPKSPSVSHRDFEILREGWCVFQLNDGTRIKARQILKRIIRVDAPAGSPQGFSFQLSEPILAVYPPPELRGAPSKAHPSSAQVQASIVAANIGHAKIESTTNEYRIVDGPTLKLELLGLSASRTSLFDDNGDPMYSITLQSNLSVGLG